jgi:hypothetical protein
MDSESIKRCNAEEVKMCDAGATQTKDPVRSSALQNSTSTGRAKTGTMVQSLKAIFEVKPRCLELEERSIP